MCSAIAGPVNRREQQSITLAGYSSAVASGSR
jgi:hypothetical protein